MDNLANLLTTWEGRLADAKDRYQKALKRLSHDFGEEGGPGFEHSSDLTGWIALREKVRTIEMFVNDLRFELQKPKPTGG